MFSGIFHLKDILFVPIIMVCAAVGTSAILIILKGLIKGGIALFKSVTGHKKKL